MTAFDGKRLTNATLKLDVDGLRRGHYADIYFQNVVHILKALQASEYRFSGHSPRVLPLDESSTQIGDLMVEAQIFNRRKPYALIAGIDVALAMLRHVTGYYYDAQFIETWHELEVDAVQDGVITKYAGDVEHVKTVIEVRGRYRDFALLETTMLGVLTRTSRIATNVYDVLKAANGKGVLFFPARFDLPQVQAIDGYAYWLAVQRYNRETDHDVHPLVSTDAQASWWGGKGGGTIPHALVACFLADTVEAMLAYARHLPSESPRIALVDFDNDTVNTSRAVLNAFWTHYRVALESGNEDEQQRWTLHGIRLDTSASVRDVSLPPDAPTGVSPALVRLVREALNNAWEEWRVPHDLETTAREYCRQVQIVVSGGFNRDRIERFEKEDVPVDTFGVGSTFLTNDSQTNTDFTMDIVRVMIDGQWIDMAKVGRQPSDNTDLQRVDLSGL